jgi:arylsulfatase A-like enzyme
LPLYLASTCPKTKATYSSSFLPERRPPTTRLPNHQAIISGYWKLVRYVTGELELYHLKRDPYEVYSLHREPEAMALRKYLLRQLARLDMCRGSGCRRQFVVPKRLTAGGLKALARVSRKGRP